MPELPDLERFSYNLNARLSGKIVKSITISSGAKHKNSLKEFEDALVGQKLTNVRRFGKQLFFDFENSNVLSMHLMLNGELAIVEKTDQVKNKVFELAFTDNISLILADYQKAANVTLNPAKRNSPDVLSDEINFEFLKKTLQRKKLIKALLMNQDIIQGIGNAYADEILWDARISPSSISKAIPEEKVKILERSIKKVLQNGIEQIGKSHPDIISGEVRDFLVIHNPKKTHSPDGAPIIKAMVAGRQTYYTDEQELYQ